MASTQHLVPIHTQFGRHLISGTKLYTDKQALGELVPSCTQACTHFGKYSAAGLKLYTI